MAISVCIVRWLERFIGRKAHIRRERWPPKMKSYYGAPIGNTKGRGIGMIPTVIKIETPAHRRPRRCCHTSPPYLLAWIVVGGSHRSLRVCALTRASPQPWSSKIWSSAFGINAVFSSVWISLVATLVTEAWKHPPSQNDFMMHLQPVD